MSGILPNIGKGARAERSQQPGSTAEPRPWLCQFSRPCPRASSRPPPARVHVHFAEHLPTRGDRPSWAIQVQPRGDPRRWSPSGQQHRDFHLARREPNGFSRVAERGPRGMPEAPAARSPRRKTSAAGRAPSAPKRRREPGYARLITAGQARAALVGQANRSQASAAPRQSPANAARYWVGQPIGHNHGPARAPQPSGPPSPANHGWCLAAADAKSASVSGQRRLAVAGPRQCSARASRTSPMRCRLPLGRASSSASSGPSWHQGRRAGTRTAPRAARAVTRLGTETPG